MTIGFGHCAQRCGVSRIVAWWKFLEPILISFPRYSLTPTGHAMTTNTAVMRFALVTLTLISASTVEAQRVDNVGLKTRADTATRTNVRVAERVFASAGGAVLGLMGGVLIASQFPAHDCGCDDPGLAEAIYGGLAGVTLGAALGASAPQLRSVCSFGSRFGRSLLGAGVGTVAGVFVGVSAGNIFVIPVGAAAGSVAALGRCWKSH